MGKILTAADGPRPERPEMPTRFWPAVIGLVLSVLIGGCTASGTAADDDKHPVFYGGVTAGGTRP
jgi:hypothetical protein